MERYVVLLSAVLLFIATQHSAIATDQHEEGSLEQTPKKKVGQLWFGPRLGRRKRNPNDPDEIFKAMKDRERQLNDLIELFEEKELPLAILAVNEAKRYDGNFVPRLGRDSGEEFINGVPKMGNERFLQDYETVGEVMSQRSPPFSPRLGKRVVPFSPRLGRENFQFDRV